MSVLSLAMGASSGLDGRLIEAGQILVTTDTKKFYVDINDTTRLAMNAAIADQVANALTINVSGAAFKTFNGSSAQTINFAAGTGMSVAKSGNNITYTCTLSIPSSLKNPNALTWGSKSYDGSSTQSITLADFGLTNVMHFLGTTTTAISDGASTNPISIGGTNKTAAAGDVVLYGSQEYVFSSDSKWELLGDEGSYALKSIQVKAGTKMSGGGAISSDVTISHAAITTTAPTTTANKFVTDITTDGYGHVTSWTNGDCSSLTLQIAGTTKTTYNPFTGAGTFNVPAMTGASTSAAGALGLVPAPAKGATTRFLTANGSWSSLSAGTGISVSGLTITNAGVRAVTRKSSNVLTVDTNGTGADITVVDAATTAAAGIVKVGSNITVNSGTISITGDNVRTAMGAASATTDGYLDNEDFKKFTSAYTSVTWGTF